MSTRVQFQQIVKEAAGKRFRSVALNSAAYRAGRRAIELIRERTKAGIDINSKRFSPYSKGYMNRKLKLARASRGSSPNKAERIPAWLRLSGRMFDDMYVRSAKVKKLPDGSFQTTTEIDFKTSRSKRIASYHLGAGKRLREFWGLSTPGSARRKKEDAEIVKTFLKELGE